MKKPNRHIWEEDSTHRSVAGKEYDEVWDYAEQLEADIEQRLKDAYNSGWGDAMFQAGKQIEEALGGE